jgi:hypothetical protein
LTQLIGEAEETEGEEEEEGKESERLSGRSVRSRFQEDSTKSDG